MSTFSTVLLLGVFQGAIMGTVLLVRSKSKPALLYLALAIIAFTITLLRLSIFESSVDRTGVLYAIPLASDLLILPLFWCFTLKVIDEGAAIKKAALPWFIPWFFFFSYALAFYALALFEPTSEAKNSLALSWQYQKIRRFEDYLTGPFNSVLGGIIVWKLLAHIRLIKDWVPDHLYGQLRVYQIFLILASFALVAVLTQVLSLYFLDSSNANSANRAAQIFYVVMIYAVGFLGYQFTTLPKFELDSIDEDERNLKFTNKEERDLETLFASGAYLDPELNLNNVSQKLGMSANRTSSLIKEVSGKNFRTYVNEYRVKAIKEKLQDATNDKYSVLSIAFECGFKSEASFYRVFKELAGSSPSEFKKACQQKDKNEF